VGKSGRRVEVLKAGSVVMCAKHVVMGGHVAEHVVERDWLLGVVVPFWVGASAFACPSGVGEASTGHLSGVGEVCMVLKCAVIITI
jgi:hypothetical protein